MAVTSIEDGAAGTGPCGLAEPAARTPEPRPAAARRLLARHWPFGLALAAGLVLRAVVWLTYRPALRFPDSKAYLDAANTLHPDLVRPLGYSVFLRLLRPTGTLATTALLQHLLALALAVGLYALLTRRGAGRRAATAACLPLLLDAYQLDIEQYVLAETLFLTLLVLALGCLLWPDRPGPRALAGAGVLLAAAGTTRTAGLPLIGLAVLYVALRRLGWRGLAALLTGFAVPLLAYAAYFDAQNGSFALGGSSARFLYGRVAQVADCRQLPDLSADERRLCEPTKPRDRTNGPEFYDWAAASPAAPFHNPAGDRVLRGFARTVVRHEPVAVTRLVGHDVLHYFAPGRPVSSRDGYQGYWQFDGRVPAVARAGVATSAYRPTGEQSANYHRWIVIGRVWTAGRGFLGDYQRAGYTPGPVLALCLLLAAAAGTVALVRRRDRRRALDAVLLGATGVVLIVVPSATAVFDYRYLLPLLVLLPAAAALGWPVLRTGPTRPRTRTDRTAA